MHRWLTPRRSCAEQLSWPELRVRCVIADAAGLRNVAHELLRGPGQSAGDVALTETLSVRKSGSLCGRSRPLHAPVCPLRSSPQLAERHHG
jgi:hypothetical protein